VIFRECIYYFNKVPTFEGNQALQLAVLPELSGQQQVTAEDPLCNKLSPGKKVIFVSLVIKKNLNDF